MGKLNAEPAAKSFQPREHQDVVQVSVAVAMQVSPDLLYQASLDQSQNFVAVDEFWSHLHGCASAFQKRQSIQIGARKATSFHRILSRPLHAMFPERAMVCLAHDVDQPGFHIFLREYQSRQRVEKLSAAPMPIMGSWDSSDSGYHETKKLTGRQELQIRIKPSCPLSYSLILPIDFSSWVPWACRGDCALQK
jgi:hypothetical protein